MIKITPQPLTAESFAPFGDIIGLDHSKSFLINEGTTRRYHALAETDVSDGGGSAILSIFDGERRPWPLEIKMLEKHPLGSQAFIPMEDEPWLVVVGEGADKPTVQNCRAFLARGDQGVQYHKGVWHHPLLPLVSKQRFLVVDRYLKGEDGAANLVEEWFDSEAAIIDIDAVEKR